MTDILDGMIRGIDYEIEIETEIGTETGIEIENVGVERKMQITVDEIEEEIAGRGPTRNRYQR